MEIGADYIATGHYARICHMNNGRYAIEKSVKVGKDQSYALYNIQSDTGTTGENFDANRRIWKGQSEGDCR